MADPKKPQRQLGPYPRTLDPEEKARIDKLLKEGAEISQAVREQIEAMYYIPPEIMERPLRSAD